MFLLRIAKHLDFNPGQHNSFMLEVQCPRNNSLFQRALASVALYPMCCHEMRGTLKFLEEEIPTHMCISSDTQEL